eukprot:64800_1
MSWTCSLCGLLNTANRHICQKCFTNVGDFNLNDISNTNQTLSKIPKLINAANVINYITLNPPPFCYNNARSIAYIYSKKTKKHYIIFYINYKLKKQSYMPDYDIPKHLCNKAVFHAYDINRNIYFELTKCPVELPHDVVMVINSDKNEICLFLNSDCLLATFNIDKNKWNMTMTDSAYSNLNINDSTETSIVYVPTIKQFCIHNAERNEWTKYKDGNKRYVQIGCGELIKFDTLFYFQLIHISCLKIVLLFGGQFGNDDGWNSDTLDYEDITEFNQQMFFIKTDKMKNDRERWKKYKSLKLPKKKWAYLTLLVLDYILVVFMIDLKADDQLETLEIWCLDMLFENKWYKCDKCIFLNVLPDRMFLTKYDFVYAMMAHQKSDKYMIKFHVSELIPNQLAKVYMLHYSKYVCGYIRLKIEKKFKIEVPTDMKQTIFRYYYPLIA